MSRNQTASAILLVLGLFLVGIGIMLMTASETHMVYTYVQGVPIPSGTETVYPYADAGSIMVVSGIICLVIGLVQSRKEDAAEYNEVHRPQIIEQDSPIVH
jgi:hypothetical protein